MSETKIPNLDAIPLAASVVTKFPHIEHGGDYDRYQAEFDTFVQTVTDFLQANNIEPEEVVFAGYNPDNKKFGNSEFDHGHDHKNTSDYFFGDFASLHNPTNFAEIDSKAAGPHGVGAEELQDEHWMVNPFNYALRGGALGVFSKAKLAEAAQIHSAKGFYNEEPQFGTYVAELSAPEVEAAKIADLFVSNEAYTQHMNATRKNTGPYGLPPIYTGPSENFE